MRRFSLLIGIAVLWAGQLIMISVSDGTVAPVLANPLGEVTAFVRTAATSASEALPLGDSSALGGDADPSPRTSPSASMRTIAHAGEDPNPLMARMPRPLLEMAIPSPPLGGSISLVATRMTYEPGAFLAVRRHTQTRLVSLEAGALDVRIDGTGAVDRSIPYSGPLTNEPLPVEGRIQLYPGDLLIIPLDAAFTARNPGEVPAVSLEISLPFPQPLTPLTDGVSAASGPRTIHREHLTAAIVTEPGLPAVMTIDQHILPPRTSMGAGRAFGFTLLVAQPIFAGIDQDSVDTEGSKELVRLVAPGDRVTIRADVGLPLAVMLVTVSPANSQARHE